jgi:DNA-binding SARP family transcriptional activator
MPTSRPRRRLGDDAKGRIGLQTLGPLRVQRDGVEVTLRPAERRLLAILALAPGQQLDSERLIDQMWGDETPPTARAALQTHVSALRRKLGNGALATDGAGYRLAVDEIDATLYLSLAQQAHDASRDSEWRACLETIARAESVWRDAPYPELRYDDFAEPAIVNLEETRLGLLELRAEGRLALGLHGEAIPELEALVAEHPLQERLWEQLMTACYRIGRYADALEAYSRVEEHLAEIGAQPGERLFAARTSSACSRQARCG